METPQVHKAEGPPKKNRRTPVHLLNPRPTHAPAKNCFLGFFLVSSRAFLGKGTGSSNTAAAHYYKKSIPMSKAFHQKTDQIFDVSEVSFSSPFFVLCFIAVSSVSQRQKFKNTTKKRFAKQSCRKQITMLNLQTVRPKIQNRFFLDLFYHVLGCFSVRGVQKHH
jgi:hypothetical protein